MPEINFPDEWLVQSMEVLTPERLAELRAKAEPGKTLWETVVQEKLATDEEILEKVSTRFRLRVADLGQLEPGARTALPEALARRYRVLPIRETDSYLEVATANPFDLDMEKTLAFATAREIRLLLMSPSKIAEQIEVQYRPEKALDRLLENMGESAELVQLTDEI